MLYYKRKIKINLLIYLDKNNIYNRGLNEFGYYCVATKKTKEILNEIESRYQVEIDVKIQPTHPFDFIAPDALIHSVIKKK